MRFLTPTESTLYSKLYKAFHEENKGQELVDLIIKAADSNSALNKVVKKLYSKLQDFIDDMVYVLKLMQTANNFLEDKTTGADIIKMMDLHVALNKDDYKNDQAYKTNRNKIVNYWIDKFSLNSLNMLKQKTTKYIRQNKCRFY